MVQFESKKKATTQKLRGGYYTPLDITNFVTKWVDCSNKKILEPSCGDGNFIESIISLSTNSDITAIELDTEEITKARQRTDQLKSSSSVNFINDDFFSFFNNIGNEKYDAIIGNPPYIRFQYFDESTRETAFDLLSNFNFKKNRLTNAWATFTQLCIYKVKEGGKLAMVLPAELLQVKYSSELRERLVQTFGKITIVSFKEIVFPGILQEVVLLLCEERIYKSQGHSALMKAVEVINSQSLTSLDLEKYKFFPASDSIAKGHKWTSIYVDNHSIEVAEKFIEGSSSIGLLGEFLNVNVGIVTGRNKFFVLPKQFVEDNDLYEYVTPLVGKTGALRKTEFSYSDYDEYSDNFPSYLLDLDNVHDSDFSYSLLNYIKLGESEDVNRGYKCRIRKRWYAVPSAHKSDGFLYRQVYKYPLLVNNSAQVVCTDTIHRVFVHEDSRFNMHLLSGAFVNSLTYAYSELIGRSYGGGVLELEPREALLLPIPVKNISQVDHELLNELLQDGKIIDALNYNDEILLKRGVGMSSKEIAEIRKIWLTLSERRLLRGKKKR